MSTIEITVPGVYDIPEDVYHADPVPGGSLSSSGARKLLPPSCPARFAYQRDNPPASTPEFDLGKAAHMVVLGAGPELHVVDAEDWRTKVARAERDEAYARGATPLLPAEFDTVQAMAAALRQHPRAAELFDAGGVAEQSLFWIDGDSGVWCRARLDWLSDRIVDYKTTTDASPAHISRVMHSFGYYIQAPFYLAGAHELDLIADDEFLFVFQEKSPPYLVTVAELDTTALRIGRERMRQALEIYRDCKAVDLWPSYSSDIETISLPGWVARTYDMEVRRPPRRPPAGLLPRWPSCRPDCRTSVRI